MEVLGMVFALGLMAFFLAVPIIALVRASKAAKSAARTESELAALRTRLQNLERASEARREAAPKATSAEEKVPAFKEPVRASVARPAPPPPHEPEKPRPAVTPEAAPKPVAPKPPTPQAVQPRAPKPPAPISPASEIRKQPQAARNLEDLLGANLFTKLGVILLVIGMTFLLMTQWHRFPPGIKISIGYLTAALMLLPGIYFEKRERWRILARAGIGGGWALAFFVTFAMHHIAASRIISSEALDLVLMLIVASAMVVHTLKYRSQVVTGLAFLLAFTTVTLSNVTAFSLLASVILALGLVGLVLRMRWYQLEVFGILATFLNHVYWLRPILARVGMHHYFSLYAASSALLIFYWLLFRVSYFVRKIGGRSDEEVSTVAALLNAGLFLGIMSYQAVHPPHPFWFLFLVGAAELGFAQLPWARRRRAAFVLLTSLGAVLLATAFPYKFSGSNLSLIWLADAEAFFLVGILLREAVFRRLGMLAGLLTAAQMLVETTRQVNHLRDAAGAGIALPHLAWVCGAGALALYLNGQWAPRKWPGLDLARFDGIGLHMMSYLATVLAGFGLWAATSEQWTVVAWAGLVAALTWASGRWKAEDLALSSSALLAFAFVRIFEVNLGAAGMGHHSPLRLATVGACVVLFYLAAPGAARLDTARRLRIPEAFTWAASTLAALLAWYELRPVSVAVAWMIFGLILLEWGVVRRSTSLRLQAYVALASSFLRMFFVNLGAAGQQGHISPRVWTMVPLIMAFFYAFWRLKDQPELPFQLDRRLRAAEVHCFFGTIAFAALLRVELHAQWVVAGWAALAVLLLAAARQWKLRVLLLQAILLSLAVLGRGILYNFFQPNYFPAAFWSSRPAAISATVGLLFLSLVFAFPLRSGLANSKTDAGRFRQLFAWLLRRPEQIFFFTAVVLLTVLLGLDMRSGLVTLAWGAEAVAIFLLALAVGERSFRLTGLGLLVLCVGKIALVDVWALHGTDRYVTLIGLGVALLLVSALYTRYRQVLHKYL